MADVLELQNILNTIIASLSDIFKHTFKSSSDQALLLIFFQYWNLLCNSFLISQLKAEYFCSEKLKNQQQLREQQKKYVEFKIRLKLALKFLILTCNFFYYFKCESTSHTFSKFKYCLFCTYTSQAGINLLDGKVNGRH